MGYLFAKRYQGPLLCKRPLTLACGHAGSWSHGLLCGLRLAGVLFYDVLYGRLRPHARPAPGVATFHGLLAITVAIIANATFTFGKQSLRGSADIIIAGLAAALFALKVNPMVVILLAALLGLVLYRRQMRHQLPATNGSAIEVRTKWHMTPLLLVGAEVWPAGHREPRAV